MADTTPKPICGAPCHYGGLSATRRSSKSDFGWMWHCNRTVPEAGTRCWQHPRDKYPDK